MANSLHISGGFVAALDGYVQAVSSASQEAVGAGANALLDGIRQEARGRERWSDYADSVTMWHDGDALSVGVRGDGAEGAGRAEFGDADHRPEPVLRTARRPAAKASQTMDAVLKKRLGV